MPTISRDRNAALLALAQAGDRRAEQELVRAHEPLCRTVAAKFFARARCRLPAEDVLQEARLGLLAAIRAIRLEQGGAFSTYATVAIENHCRRAIANSDLVRRPVCAQERGVEAIPVLSLDHPVGEEQVDTLGDLLPAEADVEGGVVAGVWLETTLQRLQPRERAAVELAVLDERSHRDVGRALGLTAEGARQVVRRGLERLRAAAAG